MAPDGWKEDPKRKKSDVPFNLFLRIKFFLDDINLIQYVCVIADENGEFIEKYTFLYLSVCKQALYDQTSVLPTAEEGYLGGDDALRHSKCHDPGFTGTAGGIR